MAQLLSQTTGCDELDALLPLGGWPIAALTEMLSEGSPTDALNLLAPLFKKAQSQGRAIALLVPPSLSYMPVLVRHGLDLRTVRIIREQEALSELDALTDLLRDGNLAALVCLVPPGASAVQRSQRQKLSRAARLGQISAFLIHSHGVGEEQEAALRLFVSRSGPQALQVRRITTAAHLASTLEWPLALPPARPSWSNPALAQQGLAAQAAAQPTPVETERPLRRSWPFRQKPKPQANPGLFRQGWIRWAA